MVYLNESQKAALENLIDLAKRNTGQSERAANFLLAWWDAPNLGGFDLSDLWSLDQRYSTDVLCVLDFIVSNQGTYPDELGYEKDFVAIISRYRKDKLKSPEEDLSSGLS